MNKLNEPDFLKRAKLIQENDSDNLYLQEDTPDFLKNAKLLESAPDEAVKYEFEDENDLEREIERNQAQQTSRMLESTFGLPGDLINFAGGLFGFDLGLPGSEKLRQVSENITGGYTKPKSDFEERAGEFMQDVSSFALPGSKHYSFIRNLGIPVLGSLSKEGIKYAGGDEKSQAIGKVGTMVLLDLLNSRSNLGSAKKYSSELFQKASDAIPEGLSISNINLDKKLNVLKKTLQAGGERPSTLDALKKIEEIESKYKNGKIDLKELTAFRPAINELIDKFKGFEIAVPPSIKQKAIRNLNELKGVIIDSAEEYGKKYNPEYLNLSRAANESYAAIQQSNKITNFLEKNIHSKLTSKAANILLKGAPLIGAISGPAGLITTGSAIPAYKILKTILRSKSPTLRNHYFNILKSAANSDVPMAIRYARKLDDQLLDLEKTGEIDEIINEEDQL